MNSFKANGHILPLGERTYVMGILNVTPDSFSDGGKYILVDDAVRHALKMQAEGADIIDIGAQSTRPGFVKISPKEELKRLIPILEALRGKIKALISIDTFYPEVAKEALKYGVSVLNDVTGFKDDRMVDLAVESVCGCIVMHDGSAADMRDFFVSQLDKMTSRGIPKERICFDPGIGFGKTYEENLAIINNLRQYMVDGVATLIGASKKRVIGMSCGNPPAEERMPGTIAAHTVAIANHVDIIRVHDVKEGVQAAKVADAILR